MSTVRLKSLLWLAAALFSLAAVLAIAAAVALPLDVLADDAPAAAKASPPAAQTQPSVPPLAWFAAAWSAKLRGALTDPPANAAAARGGLATRPIGPPVRLVGTVTGGGGREGTRGLFVTGAGKVELRGAGERLTGGAVVVRVEERAATLSLDGQTHSLRVEPASSPAAHDRLRPAPAASAVRESAGG
jgi:hypothetical protein